MCETRRDVAFLRDCISTFDFSTFRGLSKKDVVKMADRLSDVECENRKLKLAILELGLEFDAFGVPGAAEAFVKEFIRLRRLCTAEIRTFSEERFNRVADLIEKTALDMEAEHG